MRIVFGKFNLAKVESDQRRILTGMSNIQDAAVFENS